MTPPEVFVPEKFRDEVAEFDLEYRLLPLADLVEDELNPNVMDKPTFRLLVESVKREGFKDPIIVRPHEKLERKWKIIDGHHRKVALLERGLHIGPCVITKTPADRQEIQEHINGKKVKASSKNW